MPAPDLAHASLALLHSLAGAAWFGSMFYSLAVLQPRAKAFFNDDGRFEEFIATISRGARWKVLSAFALVFLSGLAMFLLAYRRAHSTTWTFLIAIKTALFFAALVVFCHASWRLWPARIFATPDEIPAFQRRFKLVGFTMILLVGTDFALGIIAHLWR